MTIQNCCTVVRGGWSEIKSLFLLEVSSLVLTLVAAMGSHRVVLPESKFSGEEDVREFLRDFIMYVAVNEWSDEKAGQYLAVFLKDDAKAFFHQQSETVKKDLRELLIRQDDLLKTPVETVVKRIATLEEESGGMLKVASVSEPSGKVNPTGAVKQVTEIEEMVNKTVELKLEEFRSSQGPLSAAVRRGGRWTGRQRPGRKPTDVCRACNGRGQWARSCPTLNGNGAGQGPRHQP